MGQSLISSSSRSIHDENEEDEDEDDEGNNSVSILPSCSTIRGRSGGILSMLFESKHGIHLQRCYHLIITCNSLIMFGNLSVWQP
jgi:hypothetical protein